MSPLHGKIKTLFMTKVINLEGSYTLMGQNLFNNNLPFRLVVTIRKKTTPNKPVQFIVAKPVPDMEFPFSSVTGHYISSLYPTRVPSLFNMEHQGVRYQFKVETDKVIISTKS